MEYRAEIDGLRAVAVLPVIFFHAGFSWFSGGYVGVDVFFVISGYLITSILLKDLDKGRFSIKKFYERRARRILPALFFVISCSTPFAYYWMNPQQFKDFCQALVATSIFSSNILFWINTDYWSPAAQENPLLHTWSLAVEEQFYLFFPLLLLLLWSSGKNRIFYVVIFLSAASLLLSEWGWRNQPSANFYLVFSRVWELGAGVICAFILQKKLEPSKYQDLAAFIGFLGILLSIFYYDDSTPFPSIYAALPVVGTALIVLFARDNLTQRILSTKFLVMIGLISFSAYLWHQPVLVFARIRSISEPSSVLMGALALLSIILAYFSWKFVEQPFRNGGSLHLSQKSIFAYSGMASAFILAVGLYGHVSEGMPYRLAPSGVEFSEINKMTELNMGLDRTCAVAGSSISDVVSSGRCQTSKVPNVLVWGDSYAMHLLQALTSSASSKNYGLIQLTKSACAPVFGLAPILKSYSPSFPKECIDFNDAVKSYLTNAPNVEYVIMSSPMDPLYNQTVNSQGKVEPISTEVVRLALNETIEFLKEIGKKPIFISPPPRIGKNLSKCSTYQVTFENTSNFKCGFKIDELSESHQKAMSFLNMRGLDIPILDLTPYICDGELCASYINGVNIYRDGGHLSMIGSAYLGRKFDLLGAALTVAGEKVDPIGHPRAISSRTQIEGNQASF